MATKNQRNLKNFFINKKFQTRFILYFLSLSIGLLGFMIFFVNNEMTAIRFLVASVQGVEVDTLLAVDNAMLRLLRIAFVFLFFAMLGTLFFAVIISHRIAGPMRAIVDYIDELKAGNFQSRRTLRPNDELIPIMDALHELADTLQEKSAPKN